MALLDSVLDRTIIYIINGVCNFLSLVREGLMIYCYWKIPYMRTFSLKLVISLITSVLIYTISNLLSYFNSSPIICWIEGYIRSVGMMSGLAWMVIMLYVSYRQTYRFTPKIYKTYPKIVLITAIVSNIPALFVIIASISGMNIGFRPDPSNDNLFCTVQPNLFITSSFISQCSLLSLEYPF